MLADKNISQRAHAVIREQRLFSGSEGHIWILVGGDGDVSVWFDSFHSINKNDQK